MKNRFSPWSLLSVAVIFFAATVLITWQITYRSATKRVESRYAAMLEGFTTENDMSRLVYSVDTAVRASYLGTVDTASLTDSTLAGYVGGIGDPYALYLSPAEYDAYMVSKSEHIRTGIGVTLRPTADALLVMAVYDNTPASRAGIVPGETVTEVSGMRVASLGYYKAIGLLTGGEAESTVTVTVKGTGGEERKLVVPRARLETPTVSSRRLGDGVGVIRIAEFTSDTAAQFKDAVSTLTAGGVDRFLIDVRNTPGGDFAGMTGTLDFLLPEGTLCYIEHKDGTREVNVSDTARFDAPMAVIINAYTSGEAEVFAAAMKSFGAAVLVGEPTFGKSLEQEPVELAGGGAVVLSVKRYLTADGVDFDGVGIEPDDLMGLSDESKAKGFRLPDEEDAQLMRAKTLVMQIEPAAVR